jgi:hypothetical protein
MFSLHRQCCRYHNHRIHLLPDTLTVVVQPYRYPPLPLPTAGEGQVGAPMLGDAQQGIIRPSASAFSSAVLLVKKHDGT